MKCYSRFESFYFYVIGLFLALMSAVYELFESAHSSDMNFNPCLKITFSKLPCPRVTALYRLPLSAELPLTYHLNTRHHDLDICHIPCPKHLPTSHHVPKHATRIPRPKMYHVHMQCHTLNTYHCYPKHLLTTRHHLYFYQRHAMAQVPTTHIPHA